MARAKELLAGTRRLVALTGAGISTDSGIPDFRGPKGVWTSNPGAERTATLAHYLADPEVRRQAWRNRLGSPAWTALPNADHRALVDLEHQGRLATLITQNIDELHQRAGSGPKRVVELHGTMRDCLCWACGDRRPMGAILDRVRAGEDDPSCELCGGILKSATISFGQSLDPYVLRRAHGAAASAEVFFVIGSTLGVQPAAGLVTVAVEAGAKLIILNAEATPYDPLADLVLRGAIGEILPPLADL